MKLNKLFYSKFLLFSLLLVVFSSNLNRNFDVGSYPEDVSAVETVSPISRFGIQYSVSGPISINPATITAYPGNGSKTNPYIIDGLNITKVRGSGDTLISVSSVTDHFIIRNCWLSGGNYGILLDSSSNGTVYNNTILNQSQHGVYLGYSGNNTVSFNHINNTGTYGIHFYGVGSINNIAYNNTIHTTGDGFNLWGNHNGYVYNNTILNSSISGINLYYSENNTLCQNYISEVDYGIRLRNQAINNSISQNEVRNCTWFGIDNAASSANNNTIEENNIYLNYYGIMVTGDSVNTYRGNVVHDNIYEGIFVQSAPNGTYVNNSVFSNGNGFLFYGSPRNMVINNSIYDNRNNGIQVSDSMSQYNYFNGNIIRNNTENGIEFLDSDYNNYTNNLIFRNQGYGIFISNSGCYNNSLIANDFIENTLQALDHGVHSKFESNFWSDHGSLTPYTSIDGSASNEDPTPVTTAYKLPHIVSNPNLISPVGGQTSSGDILIEWTVVSDSWWHTIDYSVSYSLDLGSSWVPIAGGLTNLSLSWDSSRVEYAQEIIINVTASDGILSRSDVTGVFTIENVPHTISLLYVLYPNGGEIVNDIVTITWTPAIDSWGHTVYYDVLYTLGGITGWTPVLGGTDLTQTSLNWSTTAFNYAFYVKIRVVAKDLMGESILDESDTDFDIINVDQEVSIPTLISPNGGEILFGITTVSWTPSDSTLGYTIAYTASYSPDGGTSWVNLIVDTTETSYEWDTSTVTDGSNILVKIVASDGHGMTMEDQSDNSFSIDNSVPINTTTTTTTEDSTTTATSPSGEAPGFSLWIAILLIPVVIYRKRSKT